MTESGTTPDGRSGAIHDLRGLYAVLDPAVVLPGNQGAEEDLDRALAATLAGGCRLVQYRDKISPGRILLARASRFALACRDASALFLVNDRLDVALLSGANGCHLGQDDLPLAAARRIVPPGFLLGKSTGGVPEAVEAQEEGADYIGVGPIFPTTTKADARKPGGPHLVTEAAAGVSVPTVAISGITLENVRTVLRAGASAFAVISALFGGPGITERTREFIRIWREETGRP